MNYVSTNLDRNEVKLKKLVIKPTLKCQAACDICSLRLKLFSDKKLQKELTVNEWNDIFIQAKDMGCERLCISGGEPLLYSDLCDLISLGRQHGFFVYMNTNGMLLTQEIANNLKKAGLQFIDVSIYSIDPNLNDEVRHLSGSYFKAINALKNLTNAGIDAAMQTVITKYNVDTLDQLFELASNLNLNAFWISYLEGDIEKKNLPTIDQIKNFKTATSSKMKMILDKKTREHKEEAFSVIDNLFSEDLAVINNFSNGNYMKIKQKRCKIPTHFAMVIANGEVLPCNGVEYCHEPIMGNVKEQSLSEIFYSDKWESYRKQGHAWCAKCPMGMHTSIPLT